MESTHVYSNEVPSIGPKGFGKFSLDGIEEMRERFPFNCHICELSGRRGYFYF